VSGVCVVAVENIYLNREYVVKNYFEQFSIIFRHQNFFTAVTVYTIWTSSLLQAIKQNISLCDKTVIV